MSFYIDGTKVAEPAHSGLVVTDEPLWSSNTGRSSTGKMIGDIIARKTTVEVTWPPLSYSEAKKIVDTINNAGEFFTIRYPDVEAGISSGALEMQSKTVYASNIPRQLYSLAKGIRMYTDITVTFVER